MRLAGCNQCTGSIVCVSRSRSSPVFTAARMKTVRFAAGTDFDGAPVKRARRAIDKLRNNSSVQKASVQDLECMMLVHDRLYGDRVTHRRGKNMQDACRDAIKDIIQAKRTGTWPVVTIGAGASVDVC